MTKTQQKTRQRHIPTRTCVACRTQRPKKALVRIVYTPTGEIVIDETGKQNGRGAYLCRQRICWEQAIKRGQLSKALRVSLTPGMQAEILDYAANLPYTLEEPTSTGTNSGE
jgi:predicted RNA-binding protein YlxR (DUF448 family)